MILMILILKKQKFKKASNGQKYFLSPLNPPSVSVFFEEVAAQTGIGVQQQHLLYLGHDLPLEGSMKVVNLPSTSPDQPLILLSDGLETNTSLPFRERKTKTHTHL